MSDDVFDAALAWLAAGAAVLPAAADGSKRPGLREWKSYQQRRPDMNEVATWFAPGRSGLGVVCGAVSGALEMVEHEGCSIAAGHFELMTELAAAIGLDEVWATVTSGYGERTPGGGLHLFYRVRDGQIPGNTKIARRPASPEELAAAPDDRIKVLVETRGEGGWVVCAPSNGTTHPSGLPWQVAFGAVDNIPTISMAQRDELIRMLSTLDEMPTAADHKPAAPPQSGNLLRPGDDFETKASWPQILEPHGWQRLYTDTTGRTYWRRPGKRDGISATSGGATDRDRLYVWSSSTPFDPETPYTKLGGYAVLNHGGDYSAAAASLRGQGFGEDSHSQLIAGLVSPSGVTGPTPAAPGTPARMSESAPGFPDNPGESDVADWAARNFGDRLRYSPGPGWFAWDGQCWVPQHRDGAQWAYALQACLNVPNPKGLLKWRAAATIEAVERVMRRHPALTVESSAWNPDAHLLNTPSGVVDLRTGEVLPHDPALLCTKITAYSPNPLAKAPKFFRFLGETFGGDGELMSYVQTVLGYSLCGHNEEQIVVLCHGCGGNGKSTLLGAVQCICGSYAAQASSEWLMVRRQGPHPSELVVLDGPRIVFTSEVSDAGRFDEQRLKEISGGETMSARRLYGEFYTFKPVCTLFNSANQRPEVRHGGRSFFRRMVEIPFTYEVPDDRKDPGLSRLFLTRPYGEAILSWLIAGAVAYHNGGLKMPEAVRAATEEYQRESGGVISEFVEDRCLIGGGEYVRLGKPILYEAYRQWCLIQGVPPISNILLTKLLRGLGVGEGRSDSMRFYTNVSLLSLVE